MIDVLLIAGYVLVALIWGFVVLIISKVERWYDEDGIGVFLCAIGWVITIPFFAVRTLFRAMNSKATLIASKYR